ncbi:MAG: DUF535 family protein [bacterium]
MHRGLWARYQYFSHVAGLLLDVEAHRALRSVLRRPSLAALMSARPDLGRKYLWPCFARYLTRSNRLELMRAHYRILSERTTPSDFAALLERPTPIWEHQPDAIRYAISLEYPPNRWDLEGELSLLFEMGDMPLYRLLVTLGEGAAFGRTEGRVLLIGAVQGNNGQYDAIRTATKACKDVAPRTLLLAAAAGLAEALDVEAILAVGNERHITRHVTSSDKFPFDYDQLWLEMGGVPSDGFFSLTVPLPEKSIGLVTATHRRRAMQRRASRERVGEQVRDRVEEIFRRQ